MYRFVFSAIIAFTLSTNHIFATELVVEEVPERLSNFCARISPVLQKLHTYKHSEALALISDLSKEYAADQYELDGMIFEHLRSKGVIPHTDFYQDPLNYFILISDQNAVEPCETNSDLKDFIRKCGSSEFDGKKISDFQLQAIIYNLSLKIFQKNLAYSKLKPQLN